MAVEENEESTGRAGREVPPVVAYGLTHTGKRERNEDHYLVRENLGLVVVADGWSGARGGDRAARIAVEQFVSYFDAWEEQTLPELESLDMRDGLTVGLARFAVEQADRQVAYAARHGGAHEMVAAMGAFLVAGTRVILTYAGCVQAYRLRGTELEQLTKEAPQGVVPSYPVGARTGEKPVVVIDLWQAGDLYLLCTSGLHRVLSREQIRCTLAGCPRFSESTAALVGRALHAGATDNLTAVVLRPIQEGKDDRAKRPRESEPMSAGRAKSE